MNIAVKGSSIEVAVVLENSKTQYILPNEVFSQELPREFERNLNH